MNHISEAIDNLTKRFKTNNPIEICELLDIDILYLNLGNIGGYKTTINRISTIYINTNLSPQEQLFILCHELGHILLHKGISTPFFKKINGNSYIPKIEAEANRFAVCLLLKSYEQEEYHLIVNTMYNFGIPQNLEYLL